jgi:hypothetical protein
VSGDDNVVGGDIKTPIAFVIGRVSKENISGGLGCQFVSSFGGEIGIAGATEHAQVLVGGGNSVEGDVWTSHAGHLGGEAVQLICGVVEPFYPIASRNRSLKEKGAHHIVNGVKNALDFTILRRSVWTRHLQNHPISGKECARGGIVELMTIVTLVDTNATRAKEAASCDEGAGCEGRRIIERGPKLLHLVIVTSHP